MINVHYSQETSKIIGYYLPEFTTPEPYIEIEDDEQNLDKEMCIVGGVYKEYVKPIAQQLQEAQDAKLIQLSSNRSSYCLEPIEYQGNTYATTLEGKQAIAFLANGLPTPETVAGYPTSPEDIVIDLTKSDFQAIATLIQTREMESREIRRAKTIEINDCTTLEEVAAVNINFS